MAEIRLLDNNTVDQIAAGEVVERPSSVVKELVENALDAGADAVTVEIRDGGCSFIRVTDNGGGIEKDQIRKAFFRHATSKIASIDDLSHIHSLGFRGEALSSIAAVSMVELITKPKEQLTGIHYRLEGDREVEFSEIGAPAGTTFIVRELFFNTPVRKKFLKSAAAEGSHISDLMEHMALSRPDVAFQFMMNGNVRFHTSGSGDLREIIYRIYGKETVRELLPFHAEGEKGLRIEGFLGSPSIVRANRNFEFFFVNGRYIRSALLSRGLEAGYRSFLMQHRFPFALLHIQVDPEEIDVNVHPSKMEIRFHDQQKVHGFLEERIRTAMQNREMIPRVRLRDTVIPDSAVPCGTPPVLPESPVSGESAPGEPVSGKSMPGEEKESVHTEALADDRCPDASTMKKTEEPGETPPVSAVSGMPAPKAPPIPSMPVRIPPAGAASGQPASPESAAPVTFRPEAPQPFEENRLRKLLKEEESVYAAEESRQMELFEDRLLSESAAGKYHVLGQIFGTYWLVEYRDELLILDQHAAHEKVKYEALVAKIRAGKVDSQLLNPPMVLDLSSAEHHVLQEYAPFFAQMGFEIEDFGGNAVTIRAVPCELFGHYEKDFLQEILDELEKEPPRRTPAIVEEKLASMACKSAVKGKHRMSVGELEALLEQLMKLENPYHCPHGRPTIITMSRYELEKKFKRIL